MVSKNMRIDVINEDAIYLGTEQPETCRWCGARTDFEVLANGLQAHTCLNCAKQYLVEDDALLEG